MNLQTITICSTLLFVACGSQAQTRVKLNWWLIRKRQLQGRWVDTTVSGLRVLVLERT